MDHQKNLVNTWSKQRPHNNLMSRLNLEYHFSAIPIPQAIKNVDLARELDGQEDNGHWLVQLWSVA